MKRLSTGVLAALMAVACGLTAVAAPSSQSQGNNGQTVVAQDQTGSMPPANFGSPPSGTIPILFNDHHVYAKPDTLRQGRVLAALVRRGTVLIPLRSMFEQMGATVSYDPASKTVDVSKPGADVKVTVGKPEVVINGESRPLDVPPIIYKGHVLVPIRVISEGMGAYVQWVPDRQIVVVRYIPPTPPPTPAPTEAPTVAPTVAPTPTPVPVHTPYHDLYIAGDYIISPKVYNEFSPGDSGTGTNYAVHGAFEFDAIGIPWMVEGDFEQFQYPTCGGLATCQVTTIGGLGATTIPEFTAKDSDVDGRIGIKVADPRIYIGVGYLWRTNNYGYPREDAFGFGAEKLPDLNQPLSFFGSIYYYPNLKGTYGPYQLAYNFLKYNIGVDYVLGDTPIFIEAGWRGDGATNKTNAPSNITVNGPFAGIGIKF
ncbi:MAG TPA: copper amine oxidase N-terminal domain-containing protein [Candidatus Acidoferrales bacterium]|nr:copper amine oxidase N-terminal domain-containing protein [Candidatus Acidoferrales bacterium]